MRAVLCIAVVVVASGGVVVWAGCGSDDEATADVTAGSGEAGSSGTSGTSRPDGASTSSGAPGGEGGIDPKDAGPGGDTTKITCGATSCALASDTCCVSELQSGGDNSYACVKTSDAGCPQPAGGGDVASLQCSGQLNCAAGTLCCVRETNNGAASECKAACAGKEGQLCDKNATATGCPATAPCSSKDIEKWGKLPDSYATCGGKGP